MMRRLHALRSRLPRGTAIWAALSVLFTLGLLTSIVDLTAAPQAELREANLTGQRVIIDAVSGQVSGEAPTGMAEETPFDVSNDETDEHPPEEAPPEEGAKTEPAATKPAEDAAPVSIDGQALRTTAPSAALPNPPQARDAIVLPPAPEITEGTTKQPLPRKGENGAAASNLYAKRFARQPDTAYVALVLTDVGFNAATLSQILQLPREVTVSFSPYALDPKPQIALMHNAGYETWGMLPVQTPRYPQDDPGPLGFVSGAKASEQTARLKSVLSATLGAVGLVLPPTENVTMKPDFLPILQEVEKRGLFLLSTHPERSIDSITTNKDIKAATRRADVILDSTASAAIIQSKLAGLRQQALQQRKLIVVATARPQLLAMLAEWFKTNPLGEVQLAPLSAIYAPDTPPPPPAEPEAKGGHGGGEKKKSGGGH